MQTAITDVEFSYGIGANKQHSFEWQGELLPGKTVVALLPGFNWGMFDIDSDADNAQFVVAAKTNGYLNAASTWRL